MGIKLRGFVIIFVEGLADTLRKLGSKPVPQKIPSPQI
jgi:uncharacterized membrane-anchored protein